jgi:hypothetical protein
MFPESSKFGTFTEVGSAGGGQTESQKKNAT